MQHAHKHICTRRTRHTNSVSNVLARVPSLTELLHVQHTGSVSNFQNLNLEAPAQLDMN